MNKRVLLASVVASAVLVAGVTTHSIARADVPASEQHSNQSQAAETPTTADGVELTVNGQAIHQNPSDEAQDGQQAAAAPEVGQPSEQSQEPEAPTPPSEPVEQEEETPPPAPTVTSRTLSYVPHPTKANFVVEVCTYTYSDGTTSSVETGAMGSPQQRNLQWAGGCPD